MHNVLAIDRALVLVSLFDEAREKGDTKPRKWSKHYKQQ